MPSSRSTVEYLGAIATCTVVSGGLMTCAIFGLRYNPDINQTAVSADDDDAIPGQSYFFFCAIVTAAGLLASTLMFLFWLTAKRKYGSIFLLLWGVVFVLRDGTSATMLIWGIESCVSLGKQNITDVRLSLAIILCIGGAFELGVSFLAFFVNVRYADALEADPLPDTRTRKIRPFYKVPPPSITNSHNAIQNNSKDSTINIESATDTETPCGSCQTVSTITTI